ncbi:MAG: family 43 glycosylhydrolase [Lachnospiraceae bacterium]|nr:family 43 glycosylhydrolase [Lachnospiraceae bacterium]
MEKRTVLCYTREPLEDAVYAEKLAYSMHLAISEDGGSFQPLNHNQGVLFVKATENPDGTLHAKSLKKPYLFALEDGSFAVLAVRTEADGTAEPSGEELVFFTSRDLISYEEAGTVSSLEKTDGLTAMLEEYRSFYKENGGNTADSFGITGCVAGNRLCVSKEVADMLVLRFTTPVNVAMEVPEKVCVSSAQEVAKVKATARYSDGSTAVKQVEWETAAVDFAKAGVYEIEGTVRQPHYDFPIAINRADPCVAGWNGKYYFIATNDADNNHTLYIREADTIPGLVDAEEVLLLDSGTYPGIGGLLWAPEFHVVGEDLYIFHAATPGEFFWEESHVMKLKRGGNPMCAADWSEPKRVVRADGSELCEAGKTITLDMTCFEYGGEYYAVWSQRQFLPVDLGAWLYIAKVNPEEPWKLLTEPVLLSKPEYGWANNHTFVDEGPFALITEEKIFLTFSSAAVDSTYVVGLFTAEHGADLLNPESWEKSNFPILTSRCVEGEYGTGHNAYVTDENGDIWNTYHARPGIDAPRSSGIRRVHFNAAGYPVLDLTEEKDVAPQYRKVKMKVEVKQTL